MIIKSHNKITLKYYSIIDKHIQMHNHDYDIYIYIYQIFISKITKYQLK